MHAPDMKPFSFMDGFSRYNEIEIQKEYHYKTAFATPWGTFAYRFMPFGLKNARATFQRTMTHCFRDLVHIMFVCLDNLIAQSQKQTQHIDDLRRVLLRCRKYKIHLNPFKCVLCVPIDRLQGFIVSHKGMTVDPWKVQTIFPLMSPL